MGILMFLLQARIVLGNPPAVSWKFTQVTGYENKILTARFLPVVYLVIYLLLGETNFTTFRVPNVQTAKKPFDSDGHMKWVTSNK